MPEVNRGEGWQIRGKALLIYFHYHVINKASTTMLYIQVGVH